MNLGVSILDEKSKAKFADKPIADGLTLWGGAHFAPALLERANPMTAGIWPRATALLARQALEAALDDLWRLSAPGLELCSARAQLLCLPFYLRGHEEMAERVSYTWAGLSRACHQHPYELPPTFV